MLTTQQILGLRFYDGEVAGIVEHISAKGGVLVVPAAPALVRLQRDAIYRAAMVSADAAIADSGLMVLVWQALGHRNIARISGLTYLRCLVEQPDFRRPGGAFFVLPSEKAKGKLLEWAKGAGLTVGPDDCHVAPHYNIEVSDDRLVEVLKARKPAHVVIAIGNGPQEKLGVYLRDNLPYRPALHCIGAALGFLTGDQVAIPDWADRLYLGWLLRLFAQPRIFIPRLTRAAVLPWLIFRYGERLPPLLVRGGQRTEDRGQKREDRGRRSKDRRNPS